jgi:hypothetical protein
MIIDYVCPDCNAPNSHDFETDCKRLTALLCCDNCDELWGIDIDGDEVTIYSTGERVDMGFVLIEGRENPSSETLEIFENPLPSVCSHCGMEYDEFDTGETFQSIKDDLYVASDNPEDWVYKGRHTVLGRWHALKQSMWADHLAQCEEGAEQTDEFEPWDIQVDEY